MALRTRSRPIIHFGFASLQFRRSKLDSQVYSKCGIDRPELGPPVFKAGSTRLPRRVTWQACRDRRGYSAGDCDTQRSFLTVRAAIAMLAREPASFSKCDIFQEGSANVAGVQAVINQALGVAPALNDLNGDDLVDVVDVQIAINAALGLGCAADSLPAILTLAPKATLAGTSFTLTVTGANLTGATFAFSPPLAIASAAINLGGASATLVVSPPASAKGYYTLIATGAWGPSSAIPKVGFLPTVTAFHTISIPGSSPTADPDTDGLTNARNSRLAPIPLTPIPTADRYLDGLEVLYGSDPLNPASIPVIPPSGGYLANPGVLDGEPGFTSPVIAANLRDLRAPLLDSEFGLASPVFATNPRDLRTLVLDPEFDLAGAIVAPNLRDFRTALLDPEFGLAGPSSPQTYAISGPAFSILNGTAPSFLFAPLAPSLRFLVPVDPAFIAEALARGAQRIDGKPVCLDSDGDGVCDADELIIGTNPYLADSDGDGYPDGLELALGSDPLDPKSIPDVRPPGYVVTRPVSIQNANPIARLTPRWQGAIDARNIRSIESNAGQALSPARHGTAAFLHGGNASRPVIP